MTINRPMRSLLAAALALVGAGCTAYPSPPSQPAYDTDVQPILLAHCTRCHGNGPDGGALNHAGVPGVTYNAAGPPRTLGPFLTEFGDTCTPLSDGTPGTCTNNPTGCSRCGAAYWAPNLSAYVDPDATIPMPPPPAPQLNDWELKVIHAWVAHPICSNSSRPDPTICPGP